MSVTYVDFKGSCRSVSEAKEALRSAEHSFDRINELCGCISPSEWYEEACHAQKTLDETHERVYNQFGRELYKKIVRNS